MRSVGSCCMAASTAAISSLMVGDAAVDVGPAFVNGLKAGAVERRGLHQALQIHAGVLHREVLVLKQQLFFSVKQGPRVWAS